MKPVEEWFQMTEPRRLLVTNLRTNLQMLLPDDIDPLDDDLEALLRCHLIMIRQCMIDEDIK